MTGPSSKPLSSAFEGDFAPGQVLIGRYRVVALVGEGGMGQVYLADDLVLGEPVALKFLPGRDPTRRPRSVRGVARALPGGDPLAAALAAGQTPAPEVVAAARTAGALGPRVGLALFVGCLLLVAGLLVAHASELEGAGLSLGKPEAVLVERGRELAGSLVQADGSVPFRHEVHRYEWDPELAADADALPRAVRRERLA